MNENVETLPAVQAITGEINELAAFAQSYQVATPEQYSAGAEDLKRVKAAQKRLEETRTGITGPMNAALKRVNDFFRAPAERLTVIERTIKGALTKYADEQERLRREEQRRAEEAARREREAAERAAAEARRKAAEEADRLRREAEAAAAAGRAAEAEKLAARADAKVERAETKAEALETQAATVVAPIIQREPPKVVGLATREVWRFEIVDASKINAAFLMPDEQKIRKQVAALKGDAAAIIGPGVRIWSERSIAAGAA